MAETWTVKKAKNPFRPWEGQETLATGLTKWAADSLLRKHPGAFSYPVKTEEA